MVPTALERMKLQWSVTKMILFVSIGVQTLFEKKKPLKLTPVIYMDCTYTDKKELTRANHCRLKFPKDLKDIMPTNTEVFNVQFMTLWEK